MGIDKEYFVKKPFLHVTDVIASLWFFTIHRTKWKRQTAVGFELLAEAGNLAAVQSMCRGMGAAAGFPWTTAAAQPQPPPPFPSSPASLFSPTATAGSLQQQLDLYYRQAAAATQQAFHHRNASVSPVSTPPPLQDGIRSKSPHPPPVTRPLFPLQPHPPTPPTLQLPSYPSTSRCLTPESDQKVTGAPMREKTNSENAPHSKQPPTTEDILPPSSS